MKTTLDIQGELLRRAKVEAARQGKTLTRMIEEGLTLRLRPAPHVRRELPPFPVSPHRGGLRPGIDPSSNRSMFDAADEE